MSRSLRRVLGRVPPRLRWASFFAACVLGYVAFVDLAIRYDSNARPLWKIDRAAAIEAVHEFASEHGMQTSPAEGWWSRWWTERVEGSARDKDVERYLSSHPGTAEQLVRRLVPELKATAQLLTPSGDLFVVALDPEGRRVGVRRQFPETPAAAASPTVADAGEVGQERAREVAQAVLLARTGAAADVRFQLEDVDEDREQGAAPIYTFTWKGRSDQLPELTVEALIAVREETLLRERYSLDLEDEADSSLRQALVNGVFVVLLLLALAHTTVRLVRRAREGEVSKSRGFVLGGAFLALSLLYHWHMDETLRQSGTVINLVANSFGQAFVALVLVFAWIALEGDVREALPGKLTAFDTLLSGRLLSRDVAWSSLVGIALAGPSLALLQATELLPGGAADKADKLASLMSASVAPFALYAQPNVLWTGVVVFIPLSLFLRWNRSPKRALIQLTVVLPALALLMGLVDPDTTADELATGVAFALLVLVPFLFHDLLAALWATYVMVAAPRVFYLCRQPSPTLRSDGLETAALAGLGVLALLALLRWGRVYSAEEVRPVYAKNLAERLELLAERRLANEALDRLLPAKLPAVAGVTLAASCERGASGASRFYDVLALPDDRLGVALVDLEGRGAAAALRLALLKGLLRTCSLRKSSPAAVLEDVQRRLATPGGPPAEPFTAVYATFDPAGRTLRCTRRGEASALFLRRPGGSVVALGSESAGDAEVTLGPGDALIFVSGDGALAEADLSGIADGDAETLHASICRLSNAADTDRTLVVVATAPDDGSAARSLET